MPDEIAAPSAAPTQAESSPATVNHQEVLNNLSTEQRTEWRKTGKIPDSPAKGESAPSDQSDAQQAETAPASEAGKPQEKAHKKLSADERIAQLEATIEKIRKGAGKTEPRQAEETKPAESLPAKPVEVKAQKLEAPKEPDIKAAEYSGADGWEKYEADVRKYNRDLAKYEAAEAVNKFKRDQVQEQQLKSVLQQIETGRKTYTDFDQKTAPVFQALIADLESPVSKLVGESPVFEHLMYVIGGEGEEFLALLKSNPMHALRKAVILENLIMEELKKGKAESKDTERDEKGQFKAPEKKITGAPPPPKEVGGTAAAPGDKVQEAVQKRDFSSYRTEMNRREMAARKSS
jgi:hypothetical protein